MMCSIMMMVIPRRLSSKRMARMSSTSALESPAIASSETRSRGRAAIARASSSLRISICVSAADGAWAFAARPIISRMPIASSTTPSRWPRPEYSTGIMRFCSTVMLTKGFGIWKLRAMPSRVRRWAGRPVISWPANTIRPASVLSVPLMQLMSVVLPEPLGPMRPKRSPCPTRRLTPPSAWKPPKRLVTSCTSRSVSALMRSTDASCPAPTRARQPLDEPNDAFGRQDHERHENQPHEEEVEGRGDRDHRDLLGRSEQHGTDNGPDPGGAAADHRHREAVHRVVQVEDGRRLDERQVIGERRASQAHQDATDRRRHELEPQGRHSHAFGGLLVVANRGQAASDPGPLDPPRGRDSDDG